MGNEGAAASAKARTGPEHGNEKSGFGVILIWGIQRFWGNLGEIPEEIQQGSVWM